MLDEEIDDNNVVLTAEKENWDIPKNHFENGLHDDKNSLAQNNTSKQKQSEIITKALNKRKQRSFKSKKEKNNKEIDLKKAINKKDSNRNNKQLDDDISQN